jgi:FkbM family methyltransferase
MLPRSRSLARLVLRNTGLDVHRLPRSLLKDPATRLSVTLDHLVASLLLRGTDVFFVQIGAFDGCTGDQIYDYVQRYRWSGILVEPQPNAFELLRQNYIGHDQIRLVNAAISERHETRDLWYPRTDLRELPDWAPQVASFDRERLQGDGGLADVLVSSRVQCIPLSTLLQSVERIDLLQVDVEGYDSEIIRMFDFERYQPAIVRFENGCLSRRQHDEAVDRLVRCGYQVGLADRDTLAWYSD